MFGFAQRLLWIFRFFIDLSHRQFCYRTGQFYLYFSLVLLYRLKILYSVFVSRLH